MRTFGLIGYPLSHSFSASYFSEKFKRENINDAQYLNFPIDNINLLKDIFNQNQELCGLNVTIPYKEKVIDYLNELSSEASAIGAVNTIKIKRTNNQKYLIGYNTDEYGFRHTLIPHLKEFHNKAIILGTGGASKAVVYVLKSLNIDYLIVSRTPRESNQIGYKDIDKNLIENHKIIINTTPLGMYPNINSCPDIPYEYLTDKHILYDLIYNPEKTLFLMKGEERGSLVINGHMMLILQAEKAWQIWNED